MPERESIQAASSSLEQALETIKLMRPSLDTFDDRIFALTAALSAVMDGREEVTNQIGQIRAEHGLDPVDLERQAEIEDRVIAKCEQHPEVRKELALLVTRYVVSASVRSQKGIIELYEASKAVGSTD